MNLPPLPPLLESEYLELSKSFRVLSECATSEESLERGAFCLARAFPPGAALFFHFMKSDESLKATLRFPANLLGGSQAQIFLPTSADISNENLILELNELSEDEVFLNFLNEASQMNPKPLVPGGVWKVKAVLFQGIPQGLYAVYVRNWNERHSKSLLEAYVHAIEMAYERAFLKLQLKEVLRVDPETGLFRENYFQQRMKHEISLSKRFEYPLSLLYLKLESVLIIPEYFKFFLDRLRVSFRSTDLLSSIGDREFAVLLTHTSFVDALNKAEKFLESIQEETFKNMNLTIGVSAYPSHGNSANEIYEGAKRIVRKKGLLGKSGVFASEVSPGHFPSFDSTSSKSAPLTTPPPSQ